MVFSAMKFAMSPEEAVPLEYMATSFRVVVSSSSGRTVSFGPLYVTGDSGVLRILWGDGSQTEYGVMEYDSAEVQHTYAADGEYVITISDNLVALGLTTVLANDSYSIWSSSPSRKFLITQLLSIGPSVRYVVDGGLQDLSRLRLDGRVRYCGRGIAMGDYAMSGCSAVQSLAPLSGAVVSTGKYCFERCTSLTDLSGISGFLPVAEGSFLGCSSLVSLAGLDGATTFGDRMFERCTALASLDGLPLGLTTLGVSTFKGCTSLASIAPLGQRSVTVIPDSCFRGCVSLTEIDSLVGRIVTYGPDCFRDAGISQLFDPLDTTTVRAAVRIGDRSFMDTPLVSVNMLGTSDQPLTTLGDEVFRGCRSLSTVGDFGWNLENVGEGIFRECYAEERDADGLVVSESGLGSVSFVAAWRACNKIPPYTFYGDALISSLTGLTARTVNGIDKIIYGDYCFAGCNSLASLSGFPASSVIARCMEEAGDSLPAWPSAALCEGVFMDLYKPPFQLEFDPVDPETLTRPYHYRGLVDASVLSSATRVEYLPSKFMEGCALLGDLPGQPPACRVWGDRCFARCCNMQSLDAFSRMEVTSDDVVVGEGELTVRVPRFGAECFKDCSWDEVYGGTHYPDRDDIYDPSPSNPPELHSGLCRIGGLRVWLDRIELAIWAAMGSVDFSFKRKLARLTSPFIAPFVRDALAPVHGENYDRWSSVSIILSYSTLSEELGISPVDGMAITAQDGGNDFVAFDFTSEHATGHCCILISAVPVYRAASEGSSVLVRVGVSIKVVGMWIRLESEFMRPREAKLFLYNTEARVFRFDERVPWTQILADPGGFFASLEICGDRQGEYDPAEDSSRYLTWEEWREGGYKVKAAFKLRVKFEAYDEFLGQESMEFTLNVDGFKTSSSVARYKALARGYLFSAVAAYSANFSGSWNVLACWSSIGDLLSSLETAVATSDALANVFRTGVLRAVTFEPRLGKILGVGCFDGCRSLSVQPASDTSGSLLDGFPAFVVELPSMCFRGTSVVPNAAFEHVVTIGDSAFANTPTLDLSGYPPQVAYIPARCFSGCTQLSAFGDLRNGITSFGAGCFDGCSQLHDLRSFALSAEDLDAPHGLSLVASANYSEFTDKYGYSSLAATLGSHAFRGTAISSLVYEWETLDIDIDDPSEVQAFVTGLFSDLFTQVEVLPVDRLDDPTQPEKEFRVRLKAASFEMVFSGYADLSRSQGYGDEYVVDAPGFDMNGRPLANGCLRDFRFSGLELSGDYWRSAYHWYDSTELFHAPLAVERSGFVDYGGVAVRVSCPERWWSSRDADSPDVRPCSGQVIRLQVGPYIVSVQLCLSAEIVRDYGSGEIVHESNPSQYDQIENIEYELKGVRPVGITRLSGADNLDRVPLFPLLLSVGDGCFENCTQLQSMAGLEGLVSLPSRCFAGCPFTHSVDPPTVTKPFITMTMPVLSERVSWQRRVLSAVYLYRDQILTDGAVTGITIATESPFTNRIEIAVSIDNDVRSYSVVTDVADTVTYQGETFTPTLVSVDDDAVILSLNSDFRVKLELEWADDNSYVSIDSASVYEDDVADDMQDYLRAFNGSVRTLSGVAYDYVYDAAGLGYLVGNETSHELFGFKWDRTSGAWTTYDLRLAQMDVVGHPGKTVVLSNDYPEELPSSDTKAFSCLEHASDGWFVLVSCHLKTVQVYARSVEIPASVTHIASDCFSFDGYPDTPPLQAVYFEGPDPRDVSAMDGFPFGIPPGCSIYANGSFVYREPLAE